MKDGLDHFLVAVREGNRMGEFYASTGFPLEINIWLFPVYPNADGFQFLFQKAFLKTKQGIQHNWPANDGPASLPWWRPTSSE